MATSWGAARALPPLLLDDAEAVAVAVSLRMAAGGTVSGASEAALRTLAKLDQVMPPRLRGEVRAIHEATQTLDQGQVTVDGDALLRLARACRDLVRVRFDYEARDGTPSSRTVEPVGLVATGRRWYLMAYDVDRDDWRTFRLDRLRAVEPTTWRFREREHEDPAAFVQRGVASAAYRFQARVLVHAPLAEVAERTSVRSVVLTAVDDDDHPARGRLRDALRAGLPPHLAGLGVRGAGAGRAPRDPGRDGGTSPARGRSAAERTDVGSCHGVGAGRPRGGRGRCRSS